MASPQVENGHTDIANEIVDAMCRVNLTQYESRVLWFIFRKTYGYHKTVDCISYTQFEKGTMLNRWHVARALGLLRMRNMITILKEGQGIQYGFQKDYDSWTPLPHGVTNHDPKPLPNGVMEPLPDGATVGEPPLPDGVIASLPNGVMVEQGEVLPDGVIADDKPLPNGVTKPLPHGVNTKEKKENTTSKEIDCGNHPILGELLKLSGWGSSQLANDVEWLSEFLSEYPEFRESHIRACRDYHSGKRRHTKSQWKSRLRNWMKNERIFSQGGGNGDKRQPVRANQGADRERPRPGHPDYRGG
ncbi:MAG: replication protein [Dehalococcoidia bacterium]|nr:replication protein [Dehalococcoidia bacterium]